MARIIGIISLLVFFIWEQGFAAGWLILTLFILLGVLVIANKLPILQCLIGLFLLGITFFAPPTFGYPKKGRAVYNQGWTHGNISHSTGGTSETPEQWWEGYSNDSEDDVSGYKKYYIRGFKRGLAGKKK